MRQWKERLDKVTKRSRLRRTKTSGRIAHDVAVKLSRSGVPDMLFSGAENGSIEIEGDQAEQNRRDEDILRGLDHVPYHGI